MILRREDVKGLPIGNLLKSEISFTVIMDFIDGCTDTVHIADFASGENDEVPSFFLSADFRKHLKNSMPFLIYCIDLHSLRLESLYMTLKSNGLGEHTRVVMSRFETMIQRAKFLEPQQSYIETLEKLDPIDAKILADGSIPPECFEIGVLNNDVVGYLTNYYTEYTDAQASLKGIYRVLKQNALLIVTQPCMLYPVDNIGLLEEAGFKFFEGIAIDTRSFEITRLEENTRNEDMSRLGHYSVLFFRK